jgi:protein-L-isoaspartate(D-aspartate) O-methyltransferase
MDMQEERERMVVEQIEARGIKEPAVLAAMRQVPREKFVAEKFQSYAYDDGPLPILAGQTISQPYVVALMAAELRLNPDEKVLEIGTGCGYAAAVFSRIVSQVYTVERISELVSYARQKLDRLGYDNIHIQHGDGTKGWPEHAPYDAIVVAAGGPKVPHTLREQLAIHGRMVIPVGSQPRSQRLVRVTRKGPEDFRQELLSHVRFVPLIGQQGWENKEE